MACAERLGRSRLPPIVNVGHHDSHAAMFFASPFEEALVLVMDGYGDDSSSSAYVGRGNRLEQHWSTGIINSAGLVYTFVTEHLGFAGFGDEGKVMALAAFGEDTFVERFRDVIRPTPDGGYAVNMAYFSYDAFGQLRPFTRKFIDTFGPPRLPDEPLTDRHRDLAFALQAVTEEIVLHVVRAPAAKASPARPVHGGRRGAQLRRQRQDPGAHGRAAHLGAAVRLRYRRAARQRAVALPPDARTPARLRADASLLRQGLQRGPRSPRALDAAGLRYRRMPEDAAAAPRGAGLADGKIVGWFQGRFEMGPRALGNRSILADPRRADMRDILNNKVKQREPFRPFAPAVLLERAHEFFEIDQPDPFMTLAPRVRPDKRNVIPAAVHVDGTGRIQTVERSANPRYYGLIEEFGQLTGVPVLLNTSFNRKEPIVASPEDAIACYLRTQHGRAGAG